VDEQKERVRPELRDAFDAMDGRSKGPGKERLTIVGTLARAGSSEVTSLRAVLEPGGRLRLEERGKNQNSEAKESVTVFDARSANKSQGTASESIQAAAPPQTESEDLIQTLAFDSIEHFFSSQMQGAAFRSLGTRFRLDDGTAPNYSGPYYDIYEVTEYVTEGAKRRARRKFYYVNSDTRLLELVRYEKNLNGARVNVEVRNSEWRLVAGHQVPGLIARLENNVPVLTLTVTSASLGEQVEDGSFVEPAGAKKN
jgi:hypothetical protein